MYLLSVHLKNMHFLFEFNKFIDPHNKVDLVEIYFVADIHVDLKVDIDVQDVDLVAMMYYMSYNLVML